MMKKIQLFFCFLTIAHASISQTAPDFTITTPAGAQVSLYADYLNQGKTVVLEFFFSSCPPCNSIAPSVQSLYEEWGDGQADVEFIGLSIQTWDLNTAVQAYQDVHGHTYPAAGADGGGYDAALPYTSNQFGTFTSTPTFAVIAPDGSMDFDPRGPFQTATIDSLEQSIRRTDARKPYLLRGSVLTEDSIAFQNFDIAINSDTITDPEIYSTGIYAVPALLKPDTLYQISIIKETSDDNGLSTFDIIKLRKHILGIYNLDSPYKVIAGDVNGDGMASTLDIIRMRKVILRIDNNLGSRSNWLFFNRNYTFSNPIEPFSDLDNENSIFHVTFAAGTVETLDFIGIKTGDMNASAVID